MVVEESANRPNLIVLGASNVARCVSTVVDVGRSKFGGPCNFLMAFAHGRSFQLRSQLLVRSIPGILDSGIWKVLPTPGNQTFAVITDVGNDLLYSVPVETLLDWVRICIDRLLPITKQIVLTELPLESVFTIGDKRYLFMRTILFPGCRLTRTEILDRAQTVNQGLIHLAKSYGLKTFKPHGGWYGFDPIHVKQKYKPEAWDKILSCLDADNRVNGYQLARDWMQPVRLRLLAPESRRLIGREFFKMQPAGRLADGSQIFLF